MMKIKNRNYVHIKKLLINFFFVNVSFKLTKCTI